MSLIERKWILDGAVNPQKMEIDSTLSMNHYRLTNVALPVDSSDAINLEYFNNYRHAYAFKDPVDTASDRDATYGYWDTTGAMPVPGTDGTPQDGWMVWVENEDTQYAFVYGSGWTKTGSTPTVPFMSDTTAGKAYLANDNEWATPYSPRVLRSNDIRLWHHNGVDAHYITNDASICGNVVILDGDLTLYGDLNLGSNPVNSKIIGDIIPDIAGRDIGNNIARWDIYAGTTDTTDLKVSQKVKSHLIPGNNNTWDLGNFSTYWNNFYVNTIIANSQAQFSNGIKIINGGIAINAGGGGISMPGNVLNLGNTSDITGASNIYTESIYANNLRSKTGGNIFLANNISGGLSQSILDLTSIAATNGYIDFLQVTNSADIWNHLNIIDVGSGAYISMNANPINKCGDIIPNINFFSICNSSLGDSSHVWKNLYVKSIYAEDMSATKSLWIDSTNWAHYSIYPPFYPKGTVILCSPANFANMIAEDNYDIMIVRK